MSKLRAKSAKQRRKILARSDSYCTSEVRDQWPCNRRMRTSGGNQQTGKRRSK